MLDRNKFPTLNDREFSFLENVSGSVTLSHSHRRELNKILKKASPEKLTVTQKHRLRGTVAGNKFHF